MVEAKWCVLLIKTWKYWFPKIFPTQNEFKFKKSTSINFLLEGVTESDYEGAKGLLGSIDEYISFLRLPINEIKKKYNEEQRKVEEIMKKFRYYSFITQVSESLSPYILFSVYTFFQFSMNNWLFSRSEASTQNLESYNGKVKKKKMEISTNEKLKSDCYGVFCHKLLELCVGNKSEEKKIFDYMNLMWQEELEETKIIINHHDKKTSNSIINSIKFGLKNQSFEIVDGIKKRIAQEIKIFRASEHLFFPEERNLDVYSKEDGEKRKKVEELVEKIDIHLDGEVLFFEKKERKKKILRSLDNILFKQLNKLFQGNYLDVLSTKEKKRKRNFSQDKKDTLQEYFSKKKKLIEEKNFEDLKRLFIPNFNNYR